MKFSIKLVIPLMLVAGCTKNISDYNNEIKRPAEVPAASLFSNAVHVLSDGLASPSVNVNVFRFTVKHWAMATYQDEAQYDFTTRGIPDAWWARMYRDVLNDLQESAKLVEATPLLDETIKTNQLAVIDIMQVYTFSILVNTFGNVPYSQSLDNTVLFPKYDDAKTIYADLLTRLTNDIAKINASASGFSSAQDVLAGGSMAKWLKYANSLKIALAMTIADVDDATAKTAVEAAAPNAILSADNNVQLNYLPAPNANPLFVDIVQGGRNDYLASVDLMTPLIAMADPRKSHYFGMNNDSLYAGGIVGASNTASETSKPDSLISIAEAPYIFMDVVETEFYLAEAVERGYSVGGTAAEHYNKAIKASMLYYGIASDSADKYIKRPDVAYATATGDWKQKIGFQKWIALYGRPYEGWVELRRLDYPKLTAVVGAKSGFPNRLTYPANEQQTNGGSYTSAASTIGGDKVETKIFWDKF